ncbi:MAG TPA: biotin transporter BioY [Thermoanaerobaculia bacterium]|nr:biotin transporter BioY [Thermoanaerobaculia bacterium]
MQQQSQALPRLIAGRIVRGRVAIDVLLVVGASLLIAIAAQIAIPVPFSVVPLTLQPLAVLMIGASLGRVRGAAAATLYLMEGFSGMPVFAQGYGGPAMLLAPTAGYLFSYPVAAWIAGWFSERGWSSSTLRSVAGMLVALAVIYIGGWSWLANYVGLRVAFTTGVVPFIIPDIVKIAIGAALLPQAQRLVARMTA